MKGTGNRYRANVAAAILLALACVIAGCAGAGEESGEAPAAEGMFRFGLEGKHFLIGVGPEGALDEQVKWTADIEMSGPGLERGDLFSIDAVVSLEDPEMLRLIGQASSVYMAAVLSPLYDSEGRYRQFTNLQMSTLLTPSGLPIENLQESMPSAFLGNHYRTPLELVDEKKAAGALTGSSINFFASAEIPDEVRDGHYRMALEFGAVIDGKFIELELLPYLGSIMLGEEKSRDIYLTANAIEKSKIHKHHSPVFTIGEPAPPKMPWTLFAGIDTRGWRGVMAREDEGRFAISYTGIRFGHPVYPMKDMHGRPIEYNLEPDFPTQSREQEFFEKIYYLENITVLTHVQLDPVELDYSTGRLEVSVEAPSGKQYDLGSAPFSEEAELGATTGDGRFKFTFNEYGRHIVTMKGHINDRRGNAYHGGGTYEVWIARPLSMSTSCKPGMPYQVGMPYSPRVTVHPGFPAELEYDVRLYRNSSKEDVKTWNHTGKANNYGYYFPAGEFDPMVFDTPGEYIASVTASYTDEKGRLWMANQVSASVVAPAESAIEAHGDVFAANSRPFHPDEKFEFKKRYKLYAGGYAGTPEINDMTMTQIRVPFPYNQEDVLFYSSGLPWNVVEVFPLLSFSTSDSELREQVLDRFPPFEDYIREEHGMSMADVNECWGNYYAVDGCTFFLVEGGDMLLHKTPENLPVMNVARNDLQPYAFQEDIKVFNYYYSSSIRPGLLARQSISDSSNTTAYWVATPNYFARQPGGGENGDETGDMYRFMGGIVYRDLESGRNEYAIYHSSGMLDDPRDENARIEAPLKSPLVTAGGVDYYMFPGMSPEQGAIYETGDKIVAGGFVFPSMPLDYRFSIKTPSGVLLEDEGSSNEYGLFKPLKKGLMVEEPGVYEVFFKLYHGDLSGASVGKPDGYFYLYAVEKDSPWEITFENPEVSRFDPSDAFELRGELPADWKSGRVYYTVVTPGEVYSDGELPVRNRRFSYRYVPLHAAVFFRKNEIKDIVRGEPGFFDTVLISIFADGESKNGARITAAAEVVLRGDRAFVHGGRELHGPPPLDNATPMYRPFSIDAGEGAYTSSGGNTGSMSDEELLKTKCGSCHQPQDVKFATGTFSGWRRIVNWHMDKNPLWLPAEKRRELVTALHEHLSPKQSDARQREDESFADGMELLRRKCYSCHLREPILDRSRTQLGWDNLLIRQDYWNRKVNGEPLYESEEQRRRLLEFLNESAGAEGALPAVDPDSPGGAIRSSCYKCHSNILKTYNWSESDREFIESHLRRKLAGQREEKYIDGIIDHFYNAQ